MARAALFWKSLVVPVLEPGAFAFRRCGHIIVIITGDPRGGGRTGHESRLEPIAGERTRLGGLTSVCEEETQNHV